MIKHNGYLLVKVPEDAGNFECPEQDYGAILQYKSLNLANKYVWHTIELPPSNYQIIGLAKDLAGKSDYGDLLIYLIENNLDLNTTLILKEVEK